MTYNVYLALQRLNSHTIEPGSENSLIDITKLNDPSTYPNYPNVQLGENLTNSWGIGVCLVSTLAGRSMFVNPYAHIVEAYGHANKMPRYSNQLMYTPSNPQQIRDLNFAIVYYGPSKSYDFKFISGYPNPYRLTIEMLDKNGNPIIPPNPYDWDEKSAFSISAEPRRQIVFVVSAPSQIVNKSNLVNITQTDQGFQRYVNGKLDFEIINGNS